jgi:hypothetical protein
VEIAVNPIRVCGAKECAGLQPCTAFIHGAARCEACFSSIDLTHVVLLSTLSKYAAFVGGPIREAKMPRTGE